MEFAMELRSGEEVIWAALRVGRIGPMNG